MSTVLHPASARARQLRGLLDLANFLAGHDQVPVPSTITFEVHAATDMDGLEAVGRAAHHLGVSVTTAANGTQRAARKFGPVTLAYTYHPVHVTAVTL